MDVKLLILLMAVPVLGGVLLIAARRQSTPVPLSGVADWDSWSGLLTIGIGFFDHNLVLRRANPAFHSMFVPSPQPTSAAPGDRVMTVAEWLSDGDTRHPLEPLLLHALSGKEDVSGRVWVRGGECYFVRIRRIATTRGEPMFTIVAEDIRNRYEGGDVPADLTVMVGARSRADDASDAIATSREIQRITHDLRNPLNAVLGWLHLLETDKVARDDIVPTLRRIQQSLYRQNGIIEELRQLAGPEHDAERRAAALANHHPMASRRHH